MQRKMLATTLAVLATSALVLLVACSPQPAPTPVPPPTPLPTETPVPTATPLPPTPAPTPAPTTVPATPTPQPVPTTNASTVPAACRVVGQPLYVDPKNRFCYAYPIQFKPGEASGGQAQLLGPALDASPDPIRAMMTLDITPITRTLTIKQAVDTFLQDQPKTLVAITRKSINMGGEQAEVLENVPGRMLSRNILVLKNGLLYNFWFQPQGDKKAQSDFDAVYKAVTASFSFLPDLPWSQAQALIIGGLVTKASQSHSLVVRLTLTDGRVLTTIEPKLDEVVNFISQCGAPCSKIAVSTE